MIGVSSTFNQQILCPTRCRAQLPGRPVCAIRKTEAAQSQSLSIFPSNAASVTSGPVSSRIFLNLAAVASPSHGTHGGLLESQHYPADGDLFLLPPLHRIRFECGNNVRMFCQPSIRSCSKMTFNS